MRCFLATLFLCLAVPAHVAAKPSRIAVDQFRGDRYVAVAQATGERDVTRALRCGPPLQCRTIADKRGGSYRRSHASRHKSSPRPGYVEPITMYQGFRREVGTAVAGVVGGRPAGCPARAWCGCWLSRHLGLNDRRLWLARNWAGVGSNAGGPRPGAIVVWRHHVGRITAVDNGRIQVLSGNDGRAVRNRWRTTRGVIAYRVI